MQTKPNLQPLNDSCENATMKQTKGSNYTTVMRAICSLKQKHTKKSYCSRQISGWECIRLQSALHLCE